MLKGSNGEQQPVWAAVMANDSEGVCHVVLLYVGGGR